MSPTSFSFKLTVPNDPEGATVVALMAAHAVEYAAIEAAAGEAFVERVRAMALPVLKGGGTDGCHVAFTAEQGRLTVTVGGHSLSEPLPA
ncbi:MAG TPA: hypothetical protein VF491_08000 [Vicinamibacterales bacterium]|jgi:hypothetical protein